MAAPSLQKRFRLEVEFSVTVDAIDEQHLPANPPPGALPYLQALQQALLADDRLLLQQIQMRLAGQLQDYADVLARQNPLLPLHQAEAALDEVTQASLPDLDLDFCQLTYPLRHTCLEPRLTSSRLCEAAGQPAEEPTWVPVWDDLSLQSPLGSWLHANRRQAGRWPSAPQQVSDHCFLVRSLAGLCGQVQMEAACTCGQSFLGTGCDESQAFQKAWDGFTRHLEPYRMGDAPCEHSEPAPQQN